MDDDDDDDDDNCVIVNHYGDDDYDVMMVAPCCLPVSATALALWSVISYWLRQNVVSKHPKTTSKDILYFAKSRPLTIHVQLEKFYQFCTFYCEPLATWYTLKYFDHIF